MKVALYCRVSTEEQAMHGLSLPEQIASLRAYAAQRGHIVAGEYVDPGISARKRYTKRPGLMRLLSDARAHKFSLVLFLKMDRWVRSVRDYYEIQSILDDAGVTWQATMEDYETVTAAGRLKVNIMLSVAQDEADRTGERIKFVAQARKDKGLRWGTKAPLGLRVVDARIEPDPETFDLAVEAFRVFLSMRSVMAVKSFLSGNGVTRCYNVVRRMLSNEAYIPYVGQEVFDRAQDILQDRGQRNASMDAPRVYLFSGLVRCGACGAAMAGTFSMAHGYEYYYYRCSHSYLGAVQCRFRRRVNEKKIESYLINHIAPLVDEYNAKITSKVDKKSRNEAEKVKKKLDKLKDLYLNDFIDRDTYVVDFTSLKARLDELENREEERQPVDLNVIQAAMQMYDKLSRSGKKEFWSRILKKITINEDGSIVVSFA